MVTWSAGGTRATWRPGVKDKGDLGGTRGALDGVGRGNLPPIGDGLLSREGWTLLDDSQRPLWLGEEKWLRDRPDPQARDWYLFAYGHEYGHMLSEYVKLCGRIPMLPRYAWGTWYSRYWQYSDEELKTLVNRFREMEIPLDVLVIDVDWHKYGWEGYDWEEKYFPDPEGFLKWVHEQGVYVTLNNHPGSPLPVEDTHHAAAAKMAGLSGEDLGKPLAWDLADQRKARAFVEAVHWPLEKIGIDFWWIDGNPPANMRGLNSTMWCAKTYYDGTQRRTGERSLIFSRYGGLGRHRYPAGFSGDVYSEWDVLNYEVRFTSRAGNVAFPYWSHDIGGFHGNRLDPELYIRWCQFGALSPVLRLHSNHGVRVPWEYGDEAVEITRDYFTLRHRMYPYLNTCQREVYETGMPLCRAMYMDWPEYDEAYKYDFQYMLGPSLLVAPITAPSTDGVASKSLWLPPGQWWDYWTGEPLEGPRLLVYSASLDRCPMFVKAGGIVPMQPTMQYMGQEPADPLTIDVWAGGDGSIDLYEDDGLSLKYKTDAFARTSIQYEETPGALSVLIGPRKGSYDGAAAKRAFTVVLHGVAKPTEVALALQSGPSTVAALDVPTSIPVLWEHDAATDRLTIHVPAHPATQETQIRVSGVPATGAIKLRHRLETIGACATDALKTAAGYNMAADVVAPIQETAKAANADGARYDEDELYRRVSATTDHVQGAWEALAGAESVNETSRQEVMARLVGLTASASLGAAADPEAREIRASVSTRVPLPGAKLSATPVLPNWWRQTGSGDGERGISSADGTLSLSYSAKPEKAMSEPALGALVFGADMTLEWRGVRLPVAARTSLDCSFVQQWHLIGPFSNRDGKGLEAVYEPEKGIDLTASYPGLDGTAKWQTTTWRLPTASDDAAVFIDLEPRFKPKDQAIAYAVAYIVSDEEQEAILSVGTDDGCKVWLNGEIVLTHPEPRAPSPGQDHLEVVLKKGVNTVMYKVANEFGQWGLFLQVTGRDGVPLSGVRTTLKP